MGPDSKHPHCSFICHVLDNELAKTQRVCEVVGQGAISTELWLTVVELSDAWTKYRQLHSRLFQVAANAGITDEQWRGIKRGDCYSSLTPVASTARNPHSDLRSGCQ